MIAAFSQVAGLLRSHWRIALILAAAAYAGLLQLRLAEEKLHSTKVEARLGETNMLLERERTEVRARTAAAQAQDTAHAARVERDQVIINRETVSDYQKDIAALRSRAARRVHPAATAADQGGGGGTNLPGLSEPAAGADGAAGENGLPAEDALIASEIALRLKALQEWVRGQESVNR